MSNRRSLVAEPAGGPVTIQGTDGNPVAPDVVLVLIH
jgi:hypothetical protein